MSIGSVKPFLLEPATQPGDRRSTAEAGDFAAVARSVAAGDLDAARRALTGTGTASASPTAATLSQSLAEGNLASARLALVQLGVAAELFHDASTVSPRKAATPSPTGPTATGVASALSSAAKVAPATSGRPTPATSAASSSTGSATTGAPNAAMVVADVGAAATSGGAYSVADIMLALATGNAGSIPADVINLYGPGGARYDPAAIMDAYRNSDIGKAQMAMFAWMAKPA